LDFLRIASRANDTGGADQSAKGLDFILQLGSPDNPKVQAVNQARINVYLRNVPLQQALKVITEASGTRYRIDEFAVVIYPTGAADPTLIRRDFRVPANFLSSSALNGTGGGSDDPFATPEAGSGSLIAKRLNATEKLKSLGLPFPEGATASFNGGVLSVSNTAENLEYVAEIVNIVASQEPIGVVIKTTVIDISQTDFEELGFDSIINEVNVGSNYKLSGGTTGSGTAITDTIGGNPTSSGLRIGELTGGTDSLDAIINRKAPPTASGAFASSGGSGSSSVTVPTGGGGGTTRSPGVLSFRALIDENAHELLMRGFDQKKGADVMVRPEVITRSGQNAEIASIQEFTYPTEFEPPEIPNSVGSGQSVVTPTTPTSFEVKNLGVMLEVLPEVSADRQFIEVAVKPTIREFEGFVNYGTPIVGSSTSTSFDIAGGLLSQSGNVGVLTTNDILVPVFKEVTTNTNVVVQNGHTIVIGGLLTESRKKVEDKLPILGDIPWFGRFFQTNALESESRHVIIMLNVELVDAAGESYRNR
jgi:general secretion pathway protein D